MEKNELKNGLGIASFVLGIVGFLTGFIVIGIFFDIIAIIFGLIAMISKRQKSGFGIAGFVIALVGIILTFFIGSVFNNLFSSSKSSSGASVGKSAVSQESSPAKEADTDTDLSSQIDITEYSYENSIGDTVHFYVVKNNSDKTLKITSNCTAYDAASQTIGAANGELNALGSGCESIMYEYFDGVSDIDHYDYKLSVKEDTTFDSVLSDISYDVSDQSDKVIVTCTNNSSDNAEFVEAYALFFKDGNVVSYGSTYIVDDDSELKAGETFSGQIDSYGEPYDDVKVYIVGRK